ncbi:hypothetical protein KDRO_F06810 [Kluyveromyces lactis]|nr:hypothetical protein KDRO_F06810 [Kluyveromyces lactis]
MSFNKYRCRYFEENNWCLKLQPLYQHGLMTSISDGSVHLLDWGNLKTISSIQCHTTSINDMKVINSDFDTGAVFATTAEDGVKVWDIRARNNIASLQNDKASPFFSLDSRHNMLACGTELKDYDAELHIYDIRNWSKPVRSFVDSHHDDITDIKFHPCDSNLLMSGSTDGYVNIYDLTQDDEEDALHQVINFASIHSCGWLGPKRIWSLSHMETFGIHELNDKSDEMIEPKPLEFGDVREKWGCDYVIDIYPSFIATGKSHENQGELKIIPFQNEQVDVSSALIIPDAHRTEVIRDVLIPKNQTSLLYSCGEDGYVNVWKDTTNSLNVPHDFWDYTLPFTAFENSVREIEMDLGQETMQHESSSTSEQDPTSTSSDDEHKEKKDKKDKKHSKKNKHGKKDRKSDKKSKSKSKKEKEHRYKPY